MLRFITGSAGRSGPPGRRYLCYLVFISWLFAIMPAAADIELTKNGQAMAAIVHNVGSVIVVVASASLAIFPENDPVHGSKYP